MWSCQLEPDLTTERRSVGVWFQLRRHWGSDDQGPKTVHVTRHGPGTTKNFQSARPPGLCGPKACCHRHVDVAIRVFGAQCRFSGPLRLINPSVVLFYVNFSILELWATCPKFRLVPTVLLVLFYAILQLLNFAQSLRLRWGTPRDRYVALRSDTANVNAAACYIDDDTREHQGCIF